MPKEGWRCIESNATSYKFIKNQESHLIAIKKLVYTRIVLSPLMKKMLLPAVIYALSESMKCNKAIIKKDRLIFTFFAQEFLPRIALSSN